MSVIRKMLRGIGLAATALTAITFAAQAQEPIKVGILH